MFSTLPVPAAACSLLPRLAAGARDDATSRSAPAQTRSLRSFHSSSHSEHSSHLCQCAKRFTYTFLAGSETPE
uniref:F-actin-monooxygenase MICAL2 n=1 Tax=Lates japonicus TaxID=270547 RepID=A0AAD3M6E9_LATJO|nr:F-actin-monooxygenase MICAL2 [Lates japonicus]GLD48355.1 F-actin-monooxygenase MICAL2 [Lates japonicus]